MAYLYVPIWSKAFFNDHFRALKMFSSRYVKKCASEIDLKIFEDLEIAWKLHLLLFDSPTEGRFFNLSRAH